MKHDAQHGLPISNGYSSSWSPGQEDSRRFVVHCGRCKDEFDVDAEWMERYFAASRKRVDDKLAHGYLTAGQHLDALNELDTEESAIRTLIGGA